MALGFGPEIAAWSVAAPVGCADLHPDGSLLAIGGTPRVEGPRLRIYRTSDGEMVNASVSHDFIRGVAFSRATRSLWYAAEHADGSTELVAWAEDGSHRALARYGPREHVNGLARDREGRAVAVRVDESGD